MMVLVVVMCCRLAYPFELEWMEGGTLDHVQRILDGKPIYVEPRVSFVPFIYTPFYYFVAAFVSRVTGCTFFALRLVSIVSTLACLVIIFQIVRKETGRFAVGLISSALFAGTYEIGGSWFDVGRVDSLFLALYLAALYVIRCRQDGVGNAVLAGVLLFLSFFTKQTLLLSVFPLSVYLLFAAPKRAAYTFGSLLVFVLASTAILDGTSEGWYSYYVFKLPGQHPWLHQMWLEFWTKDVFGALPLASVGAMFYAGFDKKGRFWASALIGALAASYFSRLHAGGYVNVLMPAHALICIVFGLAIGKCLCAAAKLDAVRRDLAESACLLAVVSQMCLLAYDPLAQIPTAADRAAGQELLRIISSVKGDVYVPSHGYLAGLVGKTPYAHRMALYDVVRAHDGPHVGLTRELEKAAEDRRFEMIILNEESLGIPNVEPYYRKAGRVFDDDSLFFPISGWRTRPEQIYVVADDDSGTDRESRSPLGRSASRIRKSQE